jgi:hypothetical protein
MKKTLVLFSFLASTCVASFGQDMAQYKDLTDEIFKLGLSPYEVKSYKDIQGSPYLCPELKDGKIITNNDKILVGKLRYNIYTDEIGFQYKNSLMSFAKPDSFKEFYIDNQKILHVNYTEGKREQNGFMLVVKEGAYLMLIRKSVLFFPKDRQQPYSVLRPDRFESRSDVYYIKTQNTPAVKLINLKKLVKSFPEIEEIVKNYPNKKVDFDKSEELEQFFDYINSQQTNNN